MATTWNSGDKSANVTLSGGSLTAALTSNAQGGVRATASASSGKVYFEAVLSVLSGGGYSVGWANSTQSLAANVGSSANSVGLIPLLGGNVVNINATFLGRIWPQFATAPSLITVCVAFDITNKLIWFRYNNGYWNGSATADPASGTGGFSTSTLGAGPYFPMFGANANGATCVANFGATDFGYVPPSGFSGPDTNAQAYAASSKFEGLAVLSPSQTAIAASKFEGLAVLSPSQTAAVSSKLLGYAVLFTVPPPPARPWPRGRRIWDEIDEDHHRRIFKKKHGAPLFASTDDVIVSAIW